MQVFILCAKFIDICDKSTPDLNKEDEQYLTDLMIRRFIG